MKALLEKIARRMTLRSYVAVPVVGILGLFGIVMEHDGCSGHTWDPMPTAQPNGYHPSEQYHCHYADGSDRYFYHIRDGGTQFIDDQFCERHYYDEHYPDPDDNP